MRGVVARTEVGEAVQEIERVQAVVGLAQVVNEALEGESKEYEPVLRLPRSAVADQATEDQAEIECADVNQLPLEDVLVASQMSPPHSPRFVTMREAPLDQFAPLAKQALAIVSRYPLPVAVDGLLCILLSNPVPFAGLLLFGNGSSDSSFLRRHQRRAAVITLIGNYFFDTLQVDAWLRRRRFPGNQVRHILARLPQRYGDRRRVSQIGRLQRHRQHRSRFQIDGMFRLVRQMCPAVLHLGNARVRILRMDPLVIRAFLLP